MADNTTNNITEMPKYPVLVQATFEALVDLGGCANIEAINNRVCQKLNIVDELRALQKEGKNGEYNVLDTYLSACRSWLKTYGALQKIGPSTWEITPKFKEIKTLSLDVCSDIYLHYRGTPKNKPDITSTDATQEIIEDIKPEDLIYDSTKNQDIIDKSKEEVKKQLLKEIREMDGEDFEKLIIKLFKDAYGFVDLDPTPKSHDHGLDAKGRIDVLGGKTSIDIAIQCKCYGEKSAPISSKTISEFRGSLPAGYKGIFVTTVDYSSDAIKNAEDPNKERISHINGEQLVELLIDNEVGCYRVYQLDEEEFADKKKKK